MSIISKGGRVTTEQPRGREQGPAPGTLDTIGSAINVAYDELPVTQDSRLMAGYAELIETLIDNQAGGYTDYNNVIGSMFGDDRDEDRIWGDVAKLRERDPVKYGKLPKSREEFEYGLLARQGRREQDKRIVERGGAIAGFTGGAIGYFPDPLNLATLPFGSGKTILQTALRTAGVNVGVEVAQLPSTVKAREALGEDASAAYLATRVGAAAVGGFVLGGAIKGAGVVGGKAYDGALSRLEPIIVERWDTLPAPLRDRLSKSATIDDRDLPDLAEAIIGRDNMSVDEKAAVAAMRRDIEVRDASPFKPGMAGDEAHRVRLDDALAKLLQPVERVPRAFAPPVRPDVAAPSRADLAGGTSLSTGAAPRAELKARIGRAESPSDTAKNPLSSATGRYQFISGTWLRYYKRRFGDQGLTDAQILAKRTDGRIQESLMDDLIDDNARFLRSAGEAETAGNLYLTHFAGQGGAGKLFRADPAASARSVLGNDVVNANPFLDRMNAGEVIAWAHRKMDEPAPRRAGARSELADGDDGIVYREQLQREIDRIDAETDAARAARASEGGIGDAIADIGVRSTDVADDFTPVDLPGADRAPLPPLPDAPRADAPMTVDQLPQQVLMLSREGGGEIPVGSLTNGERAALREAGFEPNDRGIIDAAALQAEVDRRVAAGEWDRSMGVSDNSHIDVLQARYGSDPPRTVVEDASGITNTERRTRFEVVDRADGNGGGDFELVRMDDGEVSQRWNGRHFTETNTSFRFKSSDDAIAAAKSEAERLWGGAQRSVDDAPARQFDRGDAFDSTAKWERPDDPAAIAQSDSVGHDLAAKLDGPRGEQLTFLFDEGGEARSWADVVAELAEDEAELAAVKACL